jgi:hypothetical protein
MYVRIKGDSQLYFFRVRSLRPWAAAAAAAGSDDEVGMFCVCVRVCVFMCARVRERSPAAPRAPTPFVTSPKTPEYAAGVGVRV